MTIEPDVKLVDTSLTKPEKALPKPQRFRGEAMKRLRKATSRAVRDNSGKIATSLLDHTLKGDVRCAKLLLELIEKKPRRPKTLPPARSLAEELRREPQWVDPVPDGNSEKPIEEH